MAAVPLGVSLFQSNYRSRRLADDALDQPAHGNLELLVHFTDPLVKTDWLAVYYRDVDANGQLPWHGPFNIEPTVVVVNQVSLADTRGF